MAELLPTIVTIEEKKLIGLHLEMSLNANRTFELWQAFMKLRKLIPNPVSTDLYSLQIYGDFSSFDPNVTFTKWAAAEVADFRNIPLGMDKLTLPGGKYAVFLYKGKSSDFAPVFQYIFGEWLPGSGYEVDNRPHFELIGARYKNDDPDSEEEIWVPVIEKMP